MRASAESLPIRSAVLTIHPPLMPVLVNIALILSQMTPVNPAFVAIRSKILPIPSQLSPIVPQLFTVLL
jgi:hypothetical protein